MKNQSKKLNIGVITFPIDLKANMIPFKNFLKIISSISDRTLVITGNEGSNISENKNMQIYLVNYKMGRNFFSRITYHLYAQLKILYQFLKIFKQANIWILPINGESLLPVILVGRFIGKKMILTLPNYTPIIERENDDYLGIFMVFLAKASYFFANYLIIYSKILIKDWDLQKYEKKIFIASEHLINFDEFKVMKNYNEKSNIIGFVGRLDEEKGVINFVKAISQIHEDNLFIEIVGDGKLRKYINNYIIENNLNDRVIVSGWVSHEELPAVLNNFKLLVLPSYTEGLPNILLEAMACGTPVLTTPVGIINDIIVDLETGFIMENNDPLCIAENIDRALNFQNHDQIIKNGIRLVRDRFELVNAKKKYELILKKV